MKKLLTLLTLLVSATLVLPLPVSAAPIGFAAALSGAEEVPPVMTAGKGLFTATLNPAQTELTFTLSASGLDLSTITASHIHVGGFGTNGPVILFLFNKATEGVFPGTKTGALTPANLIPRPAAGVSNFADFVSKLLKGETYVNVHTNAHPGGEIRGQLRASMTFASPLSGAEEVPPVATTGVGMFRASLNDAQTQLGFSLTVSGLDLSTITASHIHVGAAGTNGPVILFLFNKATEGVFPGTKTGMLTAADLIPRPAAGINNFADAIGKMIKGETYANVHTNAHPGGEVRGQIRVSSDMISIDVKPGSDPNSINVKSQGVIPVAILSTPSFDATTVDPSTVAFGRTGAQASPVHSNAEDVDGDGDLDLVLQFNVQDTMIVAGDTTAMLTGMTFNGAFVFGVDAVRAFFPGDVDGDLDVDIIDASLLAYAFESTPSSGLWNYYADFDENGIVDILDAADLGFWFGQHA